jgi:hypothetical protein
MSDFNINPTGFTPYLGNPHDDPDGYIDYLNNVDTSGFSTYIPDPDSPPLMPRTLLPNSVKTSLPLNELNRIIEEALTLFNLRYEFDEKSYKYVGYCKSSNNEIIMHEDVITGEKTTYILYVECVFQVQIYQDHRGLRAVEVNRVFRHSPMYTHVFQAIQNAINPSIQTP